MKWFSDYLSDRYQSTKFGKSKSSPLENKLGLPQGTVLSAILFSMFINDVKSVFRKCKINLFADDTAIYVTGKDVGELVETMNCELNKFNEWLSINKLKLNAIKTKFSSASNLATGNTIRA